MGCSQHCAAALARLQPLLESWLSGSNEDCWVYDPDWGMLVPLGPLQSNDPGRDFGAGIGNDATFHMV